MSETAQHNELIEDDIVTLARHWLTVCPVTGMEIRIKLDEATPETLASYPAVFLPESGYCVTCPVCVEQHPMYEITQGCADFLDAEDEDPGRVTVEVAQPAEGDRS